MQPRRQPLRQLPLRRRLFRRSLPLSPLFRRQHRKRRLLCRPQRLSQLRRRLTPSRWRLLFRRLFRRRLLFRMPLLFRQRLPRRQQRWRRRLFRLR